MSGDSNPIRKLVGSVLGAEKPAAPEPAPAPAPAVATPAPTPAAQTAPAAPAQDALRRRRRGGRAATLLSDAGESLGG